MTDIKLYEDNTIAPAKINGTTVTWGEIGAELARHIPNMMDPKKMVEQAFFLMRANPKLIQCSADSMVAALLKANSLDLDPLLPNEFWLIPRKIKGVMTVTTQTGYNGLRKQAMRSGSYRDVKAHVVFDGDDFDVELVSGEMHHRPLFNGKRGEPVCAYAVAILKDGTLDPEVMSEDQVNDIRNRSDAWKSGFANPWKTDWSEMARKTALRRLCKRLDLGAAAAIAIRDEEAIEATATPIQPARQLADIPKITHKLTAEAAIALTAEEPAEANQPLDKLVAGLGPQSASKLRRIGITTPEQMWDAYQSGDLDGKGYPKKAFAALEEMFGEPEGPDVYLTALLDVGDDNRAEMADAIEESLVKHGIAKTRDIAGKMLASFMEDAELGITTATVEQLASVWRGLVEG